MAANVVYTLNKIGFDNMENVASDAVYTLTLGTFIDNSDGTAHAKMDKVLNELKIKLYMGHDGQVYPQFNIVKSFLK